MTRSGDTPANPTSRRSPWGRLAATGAAAVLLLAGCGTERSTDIDPDAAMDLTVSTVSDVPMTVWFDSRQRSRAGTLGDGLGPTPVELSPEHPSVVLPVPYERGYWMWVRVAGPPDRPVGTVVACELRAPDGRVLATDASDPLGPPTDEAACAGAV